MNIVIAPDSFKGSLTSIQAANIMARSAQEMLPESRIEMKPMADGGEGTMDAILSSAGGERIFVPCTDALGEKQQTSYGILPDQTAVIECANIAGLMQVPESKRNPDHTTSYGVGEVMIDAMNRGCTSIVLGLGGSATNDGGLGMLQALGMRAWDKNGELLGPFGKDLLRVATVQMDGIEPGILSIPIKVAGDVDNPLCGPNGASAVYGPQKGAREEQVETYDQAFERYGQLVESAIGRSFMQKSGAGAAGGLGFALLALGAEIVSGAKLVAEETGLKEVLSRADLIITGEGQSDEQTLYGKAPGFVGQLGQTYDVPVILISGSLTGDTAMLREQFAGCFSTLTEPMPLEKAILHADSLLAEQVKQVVHFWNTIRTKS